MMYLGGKEKSSKNIAEVLRPHIAGRPYYEPFCGVCSVAAALLPEECYLSDAHPYLIKLWRAIQDGWIPPSFIGEELYYKIRANPENYPPELVGFAGFFCAFSGIWLNTYARGTDASIAYYYDADMCKHKNFALTAWAGKFGLSDRIAKLKHATFRCCAYDEVDYKPNSLIYCDPPYIGTEGYAGTDPFDHDRFWAWVRRMSVNHAVIVSEYTAPEDMVCIKEFPRRSRMKRQTMVTEKLYTYLP